MFYFIKVRDSRGRSGADDTRVWSAGIASGITETDKGVGAVIEGTEFEGFTILTAGLLANWKVREVNFPDSRVDGPTLQFLFQKGQSGIPGCLPALF